ncbi:conserved hypothetical protein, partial [Ricinus communis]
MSQVACIIVVALILGGCNKSQNVEDAQVLARVNGNDITIQQLHAELPNASLTLDKQVGQQILSRLIERQLLMQEAVKLNLDRTPEVMQALETSKAQIYAQAVIVKAIQSVDEMPMSSETAKLIATKLIGQQRKQDFIKGEVARLQGLSTIDVFED